MKVINFYNVVNAQRGVLYAKHALKQAKKEELEKLMEDFEYTCGSVFEDIEAEDDSVFEAAFRKVKYNLQLSN